MRYNIFNKAHLPLKTALINGCLSISKITNGESFSAAEALQKVNEALQVFEEQVMYEALHILPYIFEYEPSVWNNYTSDHNKATRFANNLKDLVKLCCRLQKQEDKLRIMRRISESYNEFMLFNFNHFDDEEAVLNEILWRYYPDSVLIEIERKMSLLPHLAEQTVQTTGLQIATAA